MLAFVTLYHITRGNNYYFCPQRALVNYSQFYAHPDSRADIARIVATVKSNVPQANFQRVQKKKETAINLNTVTFAIPPESAKQYFERRFVSAEVKNGGVGHGIAMSFLSPFERLRFYDDGNYATTFTGDSSPA